MLYKELRELEDCRLCPILQAGYCSGGMSPGPDGMPIEPACAGFSLDTDLDQWVIDKINYDMSRNKQRELEIQNEKKALAKTKLAQQRRKESNIAVREETAMLKNLRHWIGYYNSQLYNLEATAVAHHIDIESEDYKAKHKWLTDKLDDIQKQMEEFKARKKRKLTEIRKNREDK